MDTIFMNYKNSKTSDPQIITQSYIRLKKKG